MNRSSVFLSRLAVVAATAATVVVASAGLASAHVSVSSPDAAAGGYGKVTFRVPNESGTASTTKVKIQLPTKAPLASVSVLPVPGWTIVPTTTKLDPPVRSDDGDTITQTVSVVEFDAAKGAGIAPGEFQEFSLSVGPIPKTDSLVFNVVQSYSDGKDVAWIEPTVPGAAEPEHPAPVLKFGAAAPSTAAAQPAASTSSSSGLALAVAVVALVVAVAAVVLAALGRRRTVSS
jgi:periplasmic copper chaperone A